MPTGVITTVTQEATLRKRGIRNMIDNIDFRNAPLLKLLGLNGEKKFRLQDFPQIKYEWIEDTMPGRSSTITPALADATGTSVGVAAGTGVRFKAGDVVKVDSELMLVSSVATDTLTVVRSTEAGFEGVVGATHADLAPITKVGVARLENSDYVLGYYTNPTLPYNYTQIFDEALGVSNSEMVSQKYGISDTMAYHLEKIISDGKSAGTLPILLEQSFYHGVRYAGTAAFPRTMGGFNAFVTTNVVDKSSASLDLLDIEGMMQTINDVGGRPDTILVNSFGKRKISEFFKGTIETSRDEKLGGAVIDNVLTEFGTLKVIYDWLCPSNELYMFDSTKMGWIEYRPFDIVDVPVTVDGKVKRVIGEYGFVLLNQLAHGRIKNFSTTF